MSVSWTVQLTSRVILQGRLAFSGMFSVLRDVWRFLGTFGVFQALWRFAGTLAFSRYLSVSDLINAL